jgi:hypothetical protein
MPACFILYCMLLFMCAAVLYAISVLLIIVCCLLIPLGVLNLEWLFELGICLGINADPEMLRQAKINAAVERTLADLRNSCTLYGYWIDTYYLDCYAKYLHSMLHNWSPNELDSFKIGLSFVNPWRRALDFWTFQSDLDEIVFRKMLIATIMHNVAMYVYTNHLDDLTELCNNQTFLDGLNALPFNEATLAVHQSLFDGNPGVAMAYLAIKDLRVTLESQRELLNLLTTCVHEPRIVPSEVSNTKLKFVFTLSRLHENSAAQLVVDVLHF